MYFLHDFLKLFYTNADMFITLKGTVTTFNPSCLTSHPMLYQICRW